MTEDEFNTLAWRDFLLFAWNEPDCWSAFTAATGIAKPAAATPIEKLIDSVTGSAEATASAFVEWVTVNHWGLEHAPKAYREYLENRTR